MIQIVEHQEFDVPFVSLTVEFADGRVYCIPREAIMSVALLDNANGAPAEMTITCLAFQQAEDGRVLAEYDK